MYVCYIFMYVCMLNGAWFCLPHLFPGEILFKIQFNSSTIQHIDAYYATYSCTLLMTINNIWNLLHIIHMWSEQGEIAPNTMLLSIQGPGDRLLTTNLILFSEVNQKITSQVSAKKVTLFPSISNLSVKLCITKTLFKIGSTLVKLNFNSIISHNLTI